jgi:hypothetical protein
MEDSPLTVAGAAADWGGQLPSPHSLFHPKLGTVHSTVENQTKLRQSQKNPPTNYQAHRCYSSTDWTGMTAQNMAQDQPEGCCFFGEIGAFTGLRVRVAHQ